MHQSFIAFFTKCSVFLIDVEIIIFMKIISYIKIRPAIQVNISNSYTKPIANFTSVNTRLPGNIRKKY